MNQSPVPVNGVNGLFGDTLVSPSTSTQQRLEVALNAAATNRELLNVLKGIGRLPDGFDGACFVNLFNDGDARIRYQAVKNLGKLGNEAYIPTLMSAFRTELVSIVRKEIVSALGSVRSYTAVPHLYDLLADKNPEIVIQAIRSLLVFKDDETVKQRLVALQDHPNEIVRELIWIEFSDRPQNSRALRQAQVVSPDSLKNVVVHGDVCNTLPFVPDESIHLTFTSPPEYSAQDYSTYDSYEGYLAFLERVFAQVQRVTKEGRFLVVNTSPVIFTRVSRKYSSHRYPIPFDLHAILVKMGWEFVDDILWVKSEASVKARVNTFLQHRKPLGYKPNAKTEYLMVYRKKTSRLIDWNMKCYGDDVIAKSLVPDGFATSNVWEIEPVPVSDGVHTAVFPKELCRRVVQYYSYVGDLVFDPFAGSGTLGDTARQMDRYFFLTEIREKHIQRIKQNLGNGSLLTNVQTRFCTPLDLVSNEEEE